MISHIHKIHLANIHSAPSHKHKNPFNIKTLSIWLIFYLYLSSSAITSHSLKIYGRKITPGCTLVKFIQLFSVIKMYDSIYIHQHPSPHRTHKVSLSHPFSHTNIPKESETEHGKHETQGRFNLRCFPLKHCFLYIYTL